MDNNNKLHEYFHKYVSRILLGTALCLIKNYLY